MRKIDLNELPRWSPWPAKLLGIDPTSPLRRTREQVKAEYDNHKYAISLKLYEESGRTLSPETIRLREFNRDVNQEICASLSNDLYITTWQEIRRKYCQILLETMSGVVRGAKTVVELGCGYGYNLWFLRQTFPDKFFVGGDYSSTAVELATLLYDGDSHMQVCQFDFYEFDYSLLDSPLAPLVVFTCHAIEQLPSASHMLDVLSKHRAKVMRVFHFEPVYELHDETLIGQMRRRYAEMQGYDTDLYSELQKRPDIRIVRTIPDMIGLNPINPSSVIEWEYCL